MILRVENLEKVYRNGFAVREVNFEVDSGEILAILGPNGAGKTTIIKCVVGLRRPTSGRIDIRGKLSYLPEEKNLYRWAKVHQMIDIAREYVKDLNVETAEKILSDMKIDPSEKIANLSHGQLTALYLAITLSEPSDLYVLDEPTWGLDPLARSYILQKIRETAAYGKSVLYTSHIIEDVEKTADRILILKGGNVISSGYIDQFKERYVAVKVGRNERIDGYLYKETEDERIYIIERESAPPDSEPVDFSTIVEAIMRGDEK